MTYQTIDLTTPLGPVRMVFDGETLCGLSFTDRWDSLDEHLRRHASEVEFRKSRKIPKSAHEIRAYFDGEIGALDRIPTSPPGSDFQQRVWEELCRIPAGETTSYSELARRVGKPMAARAVGTANATNPVAIVIPCHRVIHADGSISGYGGGVDRKRWLLQHESAW